MTSFDRRQLLVSSATYLKSLPGQHDATNADGAKSVSTDKAPTGPAMPSYGWQLQDAQVAAVLIYIRNAWGNKAEVVETSEVANGRRALERRPN